MLIKWLASIATAVEWMVVALLMLMVMGVLAPADAAEPVARPARHDCNCVHYAWRALASIHVRLKTLPSIAVNDWFRHPGAYARGVANVRDIEDCHTLLHEFVHHAQWLKYGDARGLQENWQREMDAAQTTMLAEREYGRPACQ